MSITSYESSQSRTSGPTHQQALRALQMTWEAGNCLRFSLYPTKCEGRSWGWDAAEPTALPMLRLGWSSHGSWRWRLKAEGYGRGQSPLSGKGRSKVWNQRQGSLQKRLRPGPQTNSPIETKATGNFLTETEVTKLS